MKKVLSIFIALLMVVLSTINAFATETDEFATFSDVNNLSIYAEGVGAKYGYTTNVGDVYLTYTIETISNLVCTVDEAIDLENRMYNGEQITKSMIYDAYKSIDEAEKNLCVDKSELEFLVNFCKSENNDNNYYSEPLWKDFTLSLNKAKNHLTLEINDREINTAFWELYFSYNDLCVYNQVSGDVDGDGRVSVMDGTLISKYLVGGKTLNFSQKFVAAVNNSVYDGLSVMDSTEIYKFLVNDNSNLESSSLISVTSNTKSTNIQDNMLFYRAIYDRELRKF